MDNKNLRVKISSELYAKLEKETERKNIPIIDLVRLLCSQYFDKGASKKL